MSEAKFTKGEWIFDYDNDSTCEWYNAGPAIVQFSYNSAELVESEAKANAHLIAAAPQMYYALEIMLVAGVLYPSQEDAVSKILAKARGEK